ncbi:DUF4357 [Desulfonema limicola]|uniref:DUF4357 n=1 Tax=Desulfonema limicola TaxID=45656 RepID=A0A975B505_9BACT|nr:DUF4357 domain-containing protein [Desulfonema limicola]QTA78902.1 DUF4357 [Desulfonema limicola]
MAAKIIFELRDNRRCVYASAFADNDDSFIVKKGSICFEKKRKNDNFFGLRTKLIDDGILKPLEENKYIFSKNYKFNSPTTAASVIMGGNASGPFSWKLKGSNLNYKEWKNSISK